MPCTRSCAEGESCWTVVVPGIRWRNCEILLLCEVAFTVSILIDEGNKKGKTLSTLYIDVKGAFDNVFKQRLLQTMKSMKLDQKTTRWVETFLSERMACLCLDKDSEKMSPTNTGIPQGSPVSPILFLFYVFPLFKMRERQPQP